MNRELAGRAFLHASGFALLFTIISVLVTYIVKHDLHFWAICVVLFIAAWYSIYRDMVKEAADASFRKFMEPK